MAFITQTPSHIRYFPVEYTDRQQQTTGRHHASLVSPLLKASLVGGLSLTMVILINVMPVPNPLVGNAIAFLTLTGFLVICSATGFLAALLARDGIDCTQKGGRVAWLAGFGAGLFAAVMAMVLAANGLLLVDFGQSLVDLRTPAQMMLLSSIIAPHTLALVGRVLGALVLFGLIGSLVSGLVSAFAGLVWVKAIEPGISTNEFAA